MINNLPTVASMYLNGMLLALAVFAATYFHRQIGLIVLLLVGLLCARSIETPENVQQIISAGGQNYVDQWIYSGRMTFALGIVLFFAAIMLKRFVKKKKKLD